MTPAECQERCAERRKQIRSIVLQAVKEDTNVFAYAWEKAQLYWTTVHDALFDLIREGVIESCWYWQAQCYYRLCSPTSV